MKSKQAAKQPTNMENDFSSDKPISEKENDKLQRYDFAKRIANTIAGRKNSDCIVIGVYGAWGEGKTSVINFIETELKNENLKGRENITCIKFNPWRCNDENSLLIEFFQTLANALGKSLKTKGKEFVAYFRKYTRLLKIGLPIISSLTKTLVPVVGPIVGAVIDDANAVVGDVSSALEGVGDDDNIETLKEKIGEILKENKRKIVIFIDDIDRLDKTEIHSIFRLVKLNADFANTTYVLSFDDEMVSAAIGERFGSGDKKSGQDFLEKIIQVPLRIPLAQPDALKQFCFQLLDETIASLAKEEKREFENMFTSSILPSLDTPRMAIRYRNALSFFVPLLKGEVNMVDLMLIEAVKVFYPKHYEFIKSNPKYFIDSYFIGPQRQEDVNKTKLLKEQLKSIGENFAEKQRNCIQDLLANLFPRVEEALGNLPIYDPSVEEELFKHKKIAAKEYFRKYFCFSLIKGEISDKEFQEFLSGICDQSTEDIKNSIERFIKQSSFDKFLQKIRAKEDDFEWEDFTSIVRAISSISMKFLWIYESVSEFICHLIQNHSNEKEQFDIAKELMHGAKDFEFAFQLCLSLHLRILELNEQREVKKMLFTDIQYEQLEKVLIDRALKESGEQTIFEKFPSAAGKLLHWWAKQEKVEVLNYIGNFLTNDCNNIIALLRAFESNLYLSSRKQKELYEFLVSISGRNVLAKVCSDAIEANEGNADRGEQCLSNVKKFYTWLKNESKPNEAKSFVP